MADPVVSPPEVAFTSPLEHSRRQLEALLEVSEAIAQQRDLPALFHVLETRIPSEKPTGTEAPVENNPSGWVWQTQESFVVSDVEEETRFPEFLKRFREHNVRSLAIIPLTTAQRRLGAMGFGRLVPQCITDTEVQFMQRVASQVAVAVDNALNFESSQVYQKQLSLERDRLRVLLEINNVLVTSRELPEVFRAIVSTLKRVIHHDYTSLALLDPASGLLKIHALDFPGHQGLFKQEITISRDASPAGTAITTGQTLLARGAELDRYTSEIILTLRKEGLQSVCCVPLITQGNTFGSLNLASRRIDAFTAQDVELLQPVGAQIAIAVENALAFKEIDALKNKLAVEKLYLEEEIRTEFNFEEIVGESPVLKRALAQVELAAPAGTTVLLLGETGTGKELFARAIHNLSPRRDRTFVKIRNSSASEARERLVLTCVSSPPPTPIFRNWSPSAPFAATSITASTFSPFKSLRCASVRKTFLCSSAISCKGSAAALIKRSSTFPPTPWTRFRTIPGPATSANSKTSSSAR